ncbi:reverse transcriptase domain-containing protein [Tanacetum coccineum]
MFNSTLTGNARVWFNKLPKESIDSYEDLRAAFRENYHQQTKHIKDRVEIHHIKQRDRESTKDFIKRYKEEVLDMEGASQCMKIFGFMYGITHPELIKREVAAFRPGRKKHPLHGSNRGKQPSFKKGFKNKHRSDRKPDRFSLLTKEIFALEKGKFKAPPPMLRKQVDEMIKACKLSQFIKELKHKRQAKGTQEGDTTGKGTTTSQPDDLPMEKKAKQKLHPSFSPETTIYFPPLGDEDGTEGPKIIEAETGGHFVHRMSPSQNNGIIGRPGIRKIHAIPSTAHGMLKFPVEGGTVTLRSSKIIPIEWSTLMEKGRKELCTLLGQNLDVFAWKPADMTGVPRSIAEHCLNIREGCPPVRQKKRGQAPERNKAIQEEVEKLVDVVIRKKIKVHYQSLANKP